VSVETGHIDVFPGGWTEYRKAKHKE